jgi:hypothetical protein
MPVWAQAMGKLKAGEKSFGYLQGVVSVFIPV